MKQGHRIGVLMFKRIVKRALQKVLIKLQWQMKGGMKMRQLKVELDPNEPASLLADDQTNVDNLIKQCEGNNVVDTHHWFLLNNDTNYLHLMLLEATSKNPGFSPVFKDGRTTHSWFAEYMVLPTFSKRWLAMKVDQFDLDDVIDSKAVSLMQGREIRSDLALELSAASPLDTTYDASNESAYDVLEALGFGDLHKTINDVYGQLVKRE